MGEEDGLLRLPKHQGTESTTDWPLHKLLCTAWSTLGARPSPEHHRGILFPETGSPSLIWVPVKRHHLEYEGTSFTSEELREWMGADKPARTTITSNYCSLYAYKTHFLQLSHRDNFLSDGSVLNKSIIAAVKLLGGKPGHDWMGPCVVTRRTGDDAETKDIRLSDVRNLLCFLLVYNSDITPYIPDMLFRPSDKVVGVQIACDGEAQVTKTPLFKAVLIPKDSPILARGEVTGISRRIGTPVKVSRVGNGDHWEKHGPGGGDNRAATYLMLNADSGNGDWGWASPQWRLFPKTVIVTRLDGQDVDKDFVLSMASYCLDSLQKLFEASLEHKISKQEVLDAMTREAMDAAREVDKQYEAQFRATMASMSVSD